MPTRKKAQSTKKTTAKGKKTTKASSARVQTGAVPPYGDPIRAAIARGDMRQMKNTAASARKWLTDVESALAQLESAIEKSGS
jgi:Domain of unknown function (DUF1843)